MALTKRQNLRYNDNMNPLRNIAVKTLIFFCALSLSALIWIITLQTTILNGGVVKGWLRDSGVYNHLVANVSEVPPEQEPIGSLISTTTVQQALVKTFPPAYVQQQTELTIDGIYNWLEGKTTQPEFSLPINDKRTTFIQELAMAIQPRLAELPLCDAALLASESPCQPPNMSAEEYATAVATEITNREELLAAPVTQETLATEQAPEDLQTLSSLPTTVQWLQWLAIALPIVVIVCIGLITLVAELRLQAFATLAKRIFIGAAITLAGAGVLWYLSANVNTLPGLSGVQSGVVELLTPVLQKIISGIAGQLALLSGLVVAVSGAAWITLVIVQHRRDAPYRSSAPKASPLPPPFKK